MIFFLSFMGIPMKTLTLETADDHVSLIFIIHLEKVFSFPIMFTNCLKKLFSNFVVFVNVFQLQNFKTLIKLL